MIIWFDIMLLFSSMGLFKLITMVLFYFYRVIWFDIVVLFSSMGLFKLITMGFSVTSLEMISNILVKFKKILGS